MRRISHTFARRIATHAAGESGTVARMDWKNGTYTAERTSAKLIMTAVVRIRFEKISRRMMPRAKERIEKTRKRDSIQRKTVSIVRVVSRLTNWREMT